MVSLSAIWSGRALLAPQQLPREGSFLCELPALPILPSPAPGMCPQLPAALLLSPESGNEPFQPRDALGACTACPWQGVGGTD